MRIDDNEVLSALIQPCVWRTKAFTIGMSDVVSKLLTCLSFRHMRIAEKQWQVNIQNEAYRRHRDGIQLNNIDEEKVTSIINISKVREGFRSERFQYNLQLNQSTVFFIIIIHNGQVFRGMKDLRRYLSCLALFALASCTLLSPVSAIDKRSVEYRRNRSANVNRDPAETTVTARTRRRRTRGSTGNKQSRRELGKSGGKSGSSGGSSSGGSSGGGGSSGSGGSSSGGSSGGSGSSSASSGYSAYDGSYCGCLCLNDYDVYAINTHGVSCNYTVDQYSYGYQQRYERSNAIRIHQGLAVICPFHSLTNAYFRFKILQRSQPRQQPKLLDVLF